MSKKKATTHWRYSEHMKAKYPYIQLEENQLYVEEGNIITSAGSSAGIDACLHLVRNDYGAQIANSVARRLVMHSHRQGNQTQFIDQPLPKSDEHDKLSSLIQTLRANLATPHQVSSLAESVGMSSRTFQRRFLAVSGMPVIKWLTQERVSRSCYLLESTDLSIDQISEQVGFSGADTLRYHFRESLAVSPMEYRRRFTQMH